MTKTDHKSSPCHFMTGELIKQEHSCKILYIKDSCLEYPEHMGLYRRKPVLGACEQHRCRSDCISVQSDQHLCYSLIGKYHI